MTSDRLSENTKPFDLNAYGMPHRMEGFVYRTPE